MNLITHVENCIEKANNVSSKLTYEKLYAEHILTKIDGFTSSKIKHFLNDLCELQDVNYLEIGLHQGATFFSALFENKGNFTGIDNWSWAPKGTHLINYYHQINKLLLDINRLDAVVMDEDAFKVDVNLLHGINIYFYDADHSYDGHFKALTYYEKCFANEVIFIVDDFLCEPIKENVQNGTYDALKQINYDVVYEKIMSDFGHDEWFSGLGIFILRKEAKVRVIYIAGSFRAESNWWIEQNIRLAENVGLTVARSGLVPLIPHTMYRFYQGALPDDFWLNATLELMERCDAVLVLRNSENSSGTKAEIKRASEIGLPVFYDFEKLCKTYEIR